MNTAWLTRVRLKRTAQVATLAPLLLPDDLGERVASGHRLMWSLFTQDGKAQPRDFLWREAGEGVFYVLSPRRPVNEHPFLEIDPPKEFSPSLSAGDRLRFSLRANATVSRSLDTFRPSRATGDRPRRKTAHDDVVMSALHKVPHGERASVRQVAVEQAGREWFERQGERAGFALERGQDGRASGLSVQGYQVLRPPRPRATGQMRLGVVDLEGTIIVRDPVAFVPTLVQGFGRAKAFGCGLMLIARP